MAMEKKLLKKVSFYLVVITTIVLILAISVLWGWSKNSAYKNMKHILFRVEVFYKEVKVLQERLVNRYDNEYFTLITTADHMLDNKGIETAEEIQKIKRQLHLNEIYIFDSNGKIVLSSDMKSIGTGLLENEEATHFWELVQGKNAGIVYSLNEDEILEYSPGFSYVAKDSSNPDYSMILIGMDKDYGENLKEDISTKKLMEGMPTIKNESLFAVDRLTGKIVGESGDNSSWLELGNLGEGEELLQLLQGTEEGATIWFMQKPVFLMSRVVDDIILVDMFYPVVRLTGLFGEIFVVVLLAVVSLYVLFHICRKYFRKYVFDEIEMIQDDIQRIIQGDDQNIEFKTSNDTELRIITDTLNTWNRSVQSTQNRLNWAIMAANPNTAMFECFSYLNRIYFTDNFQQILGVEDDQWFLLERHVDLFWNYMKYLSENADNDGITKANNKFLKIELHESEGEYFGIVIDATEEITAQENQKELLKKARNEAETDALTGLLNRRGFEERVSLDVLETDMQQVIMLMMDVDNFKQVNDTLGHPVGDKLLQEIAGLIKSAFRKSDIIARMGGDEFAVLLLPDIPLLLLETKLQALLEDVKENVQGYNCNVSMSIGVTCVEDGVTGYEELYQHADEALYEAKAQGKNQYVIKTQSKNNNI